MHFKIHKRPDLILRKLEPEESVVTKIQVHFNRIIRPLYGDQAEQISKLYNNEERTCFLLQSEVSNGELLGILIYKNLPSSEYAEFKSNGQQHLSNSLEIKSLFLVNEKTHSGKGYGSILLQRAIQQGRRLGASTIHVTVSENVPNSIAFFQKYKFHIVYTWDGRYRRGVKEHLLVLDL